EITETAIAGNHVRHAFLDRAILAIPIDVAHAQIDNCTPRGIAECKARRDAENRDCGSGSSRNDKLEPGFHCALADSEIPSRLPQSRKQREMKRAVPVATGLRDSGQAITDG